MKIPDDVKRLAIAVAQQQGVSPHAFMVDAIKVMATAADKRAQFIAEAVTAREDALKSGSGYAAVEVKAYLLARTQGKTPARPSAKSWR